MSRHRIQGGAAGLVSAILAGRVDPFSGEILDRGPRFPGPRREWYRMAREEREALRQAAKQERRQFGRLSLTIRDLAPDPPF